MGSPPRSMGLARTRSTRSWMWALRLISATHTRSLARPSARAVTMAITAPQVVQWGVVPQPLGASWAWTQWIASPGRRPSTSAESA